jgi:hypothetical protein
MPFSAFDPVDEERVNNELEYKQRKSGELKSTADSTVADRVSKIYKDAPYIPASVIISMAKAGTSQTAIDAAKKAAMQTTANELAPNKKQNRSWFQRNVYDNVKAASRWTFAGLQLLPDLAQNVGAEIFSPNDPQGFDGWFKSTQLGTMVADSSESGSGWFFGGAAAETQAKRARRVRGTINGHAWTIGRGAADVFFTPGSKEYNILSGFVDAAVNIYADPTMIAGQSLKAARAGGEVVGGLPGTKKITGAVAGQLLETGVVKNAIIPAVQSADEIENANKLAKGLAGLNDAEGIDFKASDFGKFVTTDKRAIRQTNRIIEVAKDTGKSLEEKTLFFLENIKGIDPVTAKAFAQADDEAKVLGILGTASARLANNPDDILLSKNIMDYKLGKWSSEVLDKAKERVPLYRSVRNSKWFATMPAGSVVINGSGLDKSKAITTYANYLRGIGLADSTDEFKTVMGKVVDAYSQTDPAIARSSIHEAHDLAFETIITHAGDKSVVSNTIAKEMVTEARKAFADARAYNIDEIGWADDDGFVQQLRKFMPEGALDDFPPDAWDRLVLQGPGALVELMDEMQVLPNFRKMRSLTANPFVQRAVLNKSGEQRGVLAITEFYQNEIWKPLTLATGGYIMRNMIDAQTRIAMNGLSGMFRHPQDYMLWTFNKKGSFDITGDKFNQTVGEIATGFDNEQEKFWDAMTFDLHKNLEDPVYAQEKALKNGNFSLANRGVDRDAHTTGYVDNLALLHNDSINQKLARLRLEGLNKRQQVKAIKDWLFEGDGKSKAADLRDYFKQGIRYVDPETGKKGVIRLADDVSDDVIVEWVDRLSNFKLNTIVRDDDALRVVAGYNKVPLTRVMKNGKTVAVGQVRMAADDIADDILIEGDGAIGSLIRLDDGSEGLVVARRTTRGGVDEAVIQPVHPGTAFSADSLGTQSLRALIDAKGDAGDLALVVKRAERGIPKDPKLADRAMKSKDKFVDFFFQGIYGRATQTLEKSPVFRQFYYREVLQSADLLAPSEALALLNRATQSAAEEGISLSRYLGGKEVIDKLTKVSKLTTSEAVGTVDQLDEFAKAVALRQTKELLYNATERSNLEDVLRVVIPFGAAWKEVLGTYASSLIEDPTRVRKAQLVFTGATKFDPDNDGQGFFYKDPTTGEYSFNFPFSGDIAQLLTGQDVSLQAPVKRVSIGLGVIPSIGPVAQVAASQIIPDTPSADWITSILLPYGPKEGVSPVPMWVTRAKQAWEGNTQNLQTVYGNTYIETLRALSASGEYDLSDPNEQEQLYADARRKAQVIAGMRVLGQFFGPTSPAPEFKIDTIKGDFYGTQLVKEFQKLQATNYDTAVSEFLRIYGNDALLYISNKTESVTGGLEATDEFGDWERGEGSDILKKYADVGGFMAPGGDNFSFEVWSRQITKGRRRRLTDREIVELAQYKAASSQYRALRDKLPAEPSQEQKAWLRQWRVKLNQEYPGFPVVAEFNPGEFPKKIEQLTRLVNEKSMGDNDVAIATKQYLEAREKAIQQYVAAGGAAGGFGTAQATSASRDWLANIGKALKQETPEFARLYDRLLANEVEA